MMYDVIVVGAGPAGSTVTKKLAKTGLSVLLIDKEKISSDKDLVVVVLHITVGLNILKS